MIRDNIQWFKYCTYSLAGRSASIYQRVHNGAHLYKVEFSGGGFRSPRTVCDREKAHKQARLYVLRPKV